LPLPWVVVEWVVLIGTNWDITAQKRAESELLDANWVMEQATVRAKDLAARAEAANVAKSEFLEGV
jgi:hypothetical protein